MAKSRSVGTKFYIDDELVGSLTGITPPEMSSETTDVTDLSNSDGYKAYLGGFKDGGDVGLEGYMDGTDKGQQAMHDAFEGQEVHDCKIVFPAAIGKEWTFKGIINKFKSGDASLQDALKFSAGVKVSGKPTLGTTAAQANVEAPEATEEG